VLETIKRFMVKTRTIITKNLCSHLAQFTGDRLKTDHHHNHHDVNSVRRNVAPFPSALFSTHILPPWASTIFLATYKPKLISPIDLELYLVNNSGSIVWSTPSIFYTYNNFFFVLRINTHLNVYGLIAGKLLSIT